MTTIEGVGPQLQRAQDGTDPRGWLVFSWLPPGLQMAEDATQAADRERGVLKPRGFDRDATDAERTLLMEIGHADLPDDLVTVVKWKTTGIRNRRWPVLEETS